MVPKEPTNSDLMEELKSIKTLLMGDSEDHDDLGLVGAVHDNTRFRISFTKLAWVIVVAVFGTWGTIVAQVIINK